jgi:RNA polymerase sigma-70 factor (ECF subfamily)
MNLHNHYELNPIIDKCKEGNRRAQNELYRVAFPYAMSIALRYSQDQEGSLEIVNEAFFKAFNFINSYDPSLSFGAWLRRIVINTAIDHYHKKQKSVVMVPITNESEFEDYEVADVQNRMDAQQLLFLVQKLPPAYRMVLSLFAIEGYSHKEIADMLSISEGTSKSNYHKAKAYLQQLMLKDASYNKRMIKS